VGLIGTHDRAAFRGSGAGDLELIAGGGSSGLTPPRKTSIQVHTENLISMPRKRSLRYRWEAYCWPLWAWCC